MASQLSTFHYVASSVPAQFDFDRDDFDIKEIYQYYMLKHERTPVSLFMDKMFAQKLTSVAENKFDYEQLYVRTKALSNLAQQSFATQ